MPYKTNCGLQNKLRKENNMPTYEYKCKRCGKEFEIEQRITDAPIERCRECRGVVKRLISQSTFILNGPGWYASDDKASSVQIANDDLG